MIARLYILLPFTFTVPEKEQFNIYSYIDDGYNIWIYPPKRSNVKIYPDDVEEITVNGIKAFRANVLQIDFCKDNFDRRDSIVCDPPLDFIKKTINLFLIKLRFVTRGIAIKPLDFRLITWRIIYLNDDETELIAEEGFVRARFSKAMKLSWMTVNNQVWENLHSLPPDYIPPIWELLLLDSNDLLPEIGPSIVLAMTALEVFISVALDLLADRSSIPQSLWKWINNRQWFIQDPTTDDQFDKLLKILIGVSLKDENELWDAFKNLKKARNSFVHEGIAKIAGRGINREEAYQLVGSADKIIRFIKEKLPEDMKWPEFKYNFEVQATMKLFENKPT